MASNLKFALIGAGFIGRSHALAISAVNKVFADLELQALPNCIAEQDAVPGHDDRAVSTEQHVDQALHVITAGDKSSAVLVTGVRTRVT